MGGGRWIARQGHEIAAILDEIMSSGGNANDRFAADADLTRALRLSGCLKSYEALRPTAPALPSTLTWTDADAIKASARSLFQELYHAGVSATRDAVANASMELEQVAGGGVDGKTWYDGLADNAFNTNYDEWSKAAEIATSMDVKGIGVKVNALSSVIKTHAAFV
eukprot:1475758-Pyramimonas_sp.AAC.1